MGYLDEAFKDLHELEDGVDLQDEEEVKKAIDFMNGDTDNLSQLELIVDADADSEEDIKDTYVGELLLYCPVCHTIHYEKEENIVFDEENDEIVNVGDACPHCKQENGYEIVGKIEEYDATEDETEEENEPTEDGDVPLELDDIEDFEDEETTKKFEESFKIRKRLKEHFEEDNLEELARFTGERLHTRERVRETKKVEPKKSLKESKTTKKESKLVEKPVYGLEPRYDARKSFYGKAQVDTGDKGDKNKLYSYDTLVAEIKDGKPVVYGTYSQTTLRHIKEWLKQLGFKAENSKQILADYGAKKESCKEAKKLKEYVSSKDLKDNDILDILGIEEEQRKVKNVGSYIKQYRQLLDKGYDKPNFEIYLKGDTAYYKNLGKLVDNSKDLVVIDTTLKEAKETKLSKEAQFLKNAYEDLKDNPNGTHYYDLGLDSGLHLVVGECDDEICVKIAYNCDDLQCDYDYDWYMPLDNMGECAYVEDTLDENTDWNEEAQYLVKEAKAMDKEIASGNLVCESCCKGKKRTKQKVREGYYDYMDKDYAHILDSNVDVYDVNAYILKDSDNKFKAHYTDEYAIIVAPNGKGCVVDYEAVGQDFDSVDSKVDFGAVENKDKEYTDEKGNKHKTISMIATHRLTTTPKEIMENAPKKTMKYKDFFKKYKYNDRCASNFRELVSYLQSNGAFKGEKVTESKKRLNEGPGAGYSVKGKVTNVHNVEVISDVESESEYYSNTLMATAECDIVGVSASSYEDGREIVGGAPIPAKLEIKLDYDKEEFNGGAKQVVEALGDDFEFDATLGAGWVHSTFDGVIEGDYHDVENSPYNTDILNFTIKIENENVIKDIDKAVTGEDWYDYYEVMDTDGEFVNSFDTEDEAIDYAKKNRGVEVVHRQCQYALMDDFESEDIINEYTEGTVWEREYTKSYKYDDEQEEALDTKKVPPVITAKQKACKDKECKKKIKEYKLNEDAFNEYQEIIDRAKLNIDDGDEVDNAIWDAIDNEPYLDEFEILKDNFNINDLYFDNGEPVSTVIMEIIFNSVYDEVSDYYSEKHNDVEVDESLQSQKRTVEQIKESIKAKLDKTIKEGLEKDGGSEKHYQTLKSNNCDLIALTKYDGGDPVDYVKSDEDLEDWLNQNPEHSWFPVDLEDEDEEDFDESLFESLVDRYCQRVYDNVRDFKTTSCSKKDKKFIVEGILHYTNGKKAKTTFTFKEAKATNGKRRFVGLNETFSKDNKAFTLLVSTDNKKLLSESLSYKYNVEYKGEQKEIKGKIVTPKH